MIIYHGTYKDNAQLILQNGFDSNKIGSNWGLTYGRGFYFSPNLQEAQCYGDAVIKCEIIINRPYKLGEKIPKSLKRPHSEWSIMYDALIDCTGNEIIIPISRMNEIKIISVLD